MTAYNPDPIYAGDTWPGIPALSLLIDAAPPSVAVTGSRMIFFKAGGVPGNSPATGTTLASPAAITITDAAGWTFAVPPVILPLAAGDWILHFKTTDAAGAVKTWFAGTLTIL